MTATEKGIFWGRSKQVVQNRVGEHTCDVRQLEVQIQKSRSAMATLEDKLRVANDVIARQNADLAEAVAARKAAVREYEVAESEANELHEFLQASVKRSILCYTTNYLSEVSYRFWCLSKAGFFFTDFAASTTTEFPIP